ncbi:Non-specific serine/threonine protein kinase [Rhodovastum atsumiense]|uniref:Protein kinase family protein n=1 Tax=Rhodovastum atsumiense TaxID=504468 RepID=A0A5M6IRA7_9PROT|nr:protein kinase family protein [Rhodovastum atsumiense]KAA5609995.1 protein kinase family protein [Rhodovastum atsumiense]CAH2598638.1 Non-specific serine/threonine protein kinase [Rhodovastum atsumiense]
MSFPLITDYRKALANAKTRFTTLEITPELDQFQQPLFFAGNFAGVFRVRDLQGHPLALKCFTRAMPELERRYRAIARYIRTNRPACMVDLSYLPREVYVTSTVATSGDYPVVTMPWLEGRSLGAAIRTICSKGNRQALAALTRAWARLCLDLLERGVAHGDLKHDNVIIVPGSKLKLIDYDSMFLPEMKGLAANLLGGVNFQHPARKPRHFNATLDHFSMLVILLSLRALTFDPDLFEAHHNGENIILSRDDFLDPDSSKSMLRQLLRTRDRYTRECAMALIKSCKQEGIMIPGIRSILTAGLRVDTVERAAEPPRLFSFLPLR